MWLVICELNDVSALWAYRGLKARGLLPIEILSADMLAYSLRWEHWLGNDSVGVGITLADGRNIRSDTILGVLNRLQTIPSAHLRANPADRDYASQELFAFFMSWIYSLPRTVLNRPGSQSLSGQWRHASEWVWLAARAGLATPRYRQNSCDETDMMRSRGRITSAGTPVNTVIVVDGLVVGASAPPDVIRGCKRLSELSMTPLLGVEFTASPIEPWTFAGATLLPDLRLGGEALLDALALVLRGKPER